MKVPFIDLTREAKLLMPDLLKSTEDVLKSGVYIDGLYVQELEKNLEEYLGVNNVVSVGNGSDALTFILKSLNLKSKDEVICPANSFIATAWSIVAAGAKPVFCDVKNDLLIDENDFKNKITKNTKVVIPVHLTGRVCDLEIIESICAPKNIKIVEDAAQSFGAINNRGKKTGGLGLAGAFSLHPLKNLSIYGDGGLITTNNNELADRCRLYRNHGLENRDKASIWGYNSRLDSLQASFAQIKLNHIEQFTKKYIEIAHFYSKNITDQVKKPLIRNDFRDVYHNYVVLVPPEVRNKIIRDLETIGVQTKIHYPIPLHLQECAKDLNYKIGDMPNTELFSKSMISLPIFPTLNNNELDYVSESFNKVFNEL